MHKLIENVGLRAIGNFTLTSERGFDSFKSLLAASPLRAFNFINVEWCERLPET